MSLTPSAADKKARTLSEAMPYIQRFFDKTIVVKYGGNAMTDPALQRAFAEDVVFLRYVGLKPVVVHGGGPQVTGHLDRLGIDSVFTAGLRVTTEETIDVVRMVLNGKVNKDIVGLVNRYGPYAVGLSGEDANLFTAERKLATVDGAAVDIGLGKIRRRLAQDLIGLPQLAVLPLQGLQLLGHLRRDTNPFAAVDLDLLDPLVQGLRRAADLRCHGFNRGPARRMLVFMIEHQPNRPATHFR